MPGVGWTADRREAIIDKSGRQHPILTLYRAIPKHRTRGMLLLIGLTLLSAVLDIISIGAVVPFLALLVDPGLAGSGWLGWIVSIFPEGEAGVGVAALIFAGAAILAALVRLSLARTTGHLSFSIAHDLNQASFRWLLHQPYSYHLKTHTGEVLARFEKISDVTFTVVLGGIEAIASTAIGFGILVFLLAISPPEVMAAALGLISFYLFAALAMRSRLRRNSRQASEATSRLFRIVQQAMGGIRDIILDRSQDAFERDFQVTSDEARRSYISTAFIGQAPRILIEAAGIVAIALLAWYLSRGPGGLVASIPLLGALAIGAQRLLPIAQTAYRGWSNFASSSAQLADVAEMIGPVRDRDGDYLAAQDMSVGAIAFENVGFAYDGRKPALRDINLVIAGGERLGIAGASGAGKSTMVDLLLGLIEPTSGNISVDRRALTGPTLALWQSQVAHVPQETYLSEASLAANIAFGVENSPDMRRIEVAARRAGIDEFIAGLPDGYDTLAGERGVRLSGGQRQRIAIARALYKQANVLVFDEATSALDSETESLLLDSIMSLAGEVTIILVSHRDAVLSRCDQVVTFRDGCVVDDRPAHSPKFAAGA